MTCHPSPPPASIQELAQKTGPRCQATELVDLDPDIWGNDIEHHHCRYAPSHSTLPHKCNVCDHTWPTNAQPA